jgi:hypothetical protein
MVFYGDTDVSIMLRQILNKQCMYSREMKPFCFSARWKDFVIMGMNRPQERETYWLFKNYELLKMKSAPLRYSIVQAK